LGIFEGEGKTVPTKVFPLRGTKNAWGGSDHFMLGKVVKKERRGGKTDIAKQRKTLEKDSPNTGFATLKKIKPLRIKVIKP